MQEVVQVIVTLDECLTAVQLAFSAVKKHWRRASRRGVAIRKEAGFTPDSPAGAFLTHHAKRAGSVSGGLSRHTLGGADA